MTKIISILNQKGGVGKTTISQHLIVGLRKKGYRVLAVDFDAQCDLTFIFNIENNRMIFKYTIVLTVILFAFANCLEFSSSIKPMK